MSAPAHAKEHDNLTVLLAKSIEFSKLIDGVILITIGKDGRPCVGGNVDNPATMLRILRELAAAESLVEDVSKVLVPRNN